MPLKIAGLSVALTIAASLVILPSFAIAGTSTMSAESRGFTCEPATAANKLPTPPPMWEASGKPPTTEEVAYANSIKPLCPKGQVPSPVANGPAAPLDTPTTSTTQFGAADQAATPSQSERYAVPPGYNGEHCQIVFVEKEKREVEEEGCYWWVRNQVTKKAVGMEYVTNVSEPQVSTFPGAHSIDQLGVTAGGAAGNHNTIEAGVDTDPSMFGKSSKPHFFIYVNNNGYGYESNKYTSEPDCYDCHFHPEYETTLVPGDELPASSAHFKIGVEFWGGEWWIWAGTQWIGYVEPSFWNNEFKKGEYELNFGEVYDNNSTPTTAMGDGQFGSNLGATLMTAPVVMLTENEEVTTGLESEPTVTNSKLYSLGSINKGRTEWHFGGPGIDPPGAVKSSTWALENSAATNLNTFYKNSSSNMANEYWLEGWSNQVLTGGFSGTPQAIENIEGSNINVFYDNESGELGDEYWLPGSGWATANFEGAVSGTPTATVNTEDTNINAFYRNTSNQLVNVYWTQSSGWTSQTLTGGVGGTPVAIENEQSNNMNVFYKTTGGELADEYWTPSSGWSNQVLAGGISGTPAAIENVEGNNMNVFYENTSDQLVDEYWVNGNPGNGWASQTLANSMYGTPTVTENNAGNNMNVLYKNISGQLVDEYWVNGNPNNGWASQALTEGGVSGTPGMTENSQGSNMNVFYRNTSDQLVDEYWIAGSGGNGWANTVLANGITAP